MPSGRILHKERGGDARERRSSVQVKCLSTKNKAQQVSLLGFIGLGTDTPFKGVPLL